MDPQARKVFAEGIARATEQHAGAALDAALEEVGWRDALEAEPRDAVEVLFHAQGTAAATSSALDDVLAQALGLDPAATAVLLPSLGSYAPPAKLSNGRVALRGLASGLSRRSALAFAVDDGTRDFSVALVDPAAITRAPREGMDPSLGLVDVVAELPADSLTWRRSASPWSVAVAAGQVALAYQLVGGAQAMLRLAREHAVDRVQFGRPIASFQAVRHRLADSLIAVEGAAAATDLAVQEPSAFSAAMAKAIAGTSARTVSRHAQQVLGGMGYTTDHPLHRYVRRTLVLDQLLGAGRVLTREIGAQLLQSRRVPHIGRL